MPTTEINITFLASKNENSPVFMMLRYYGLKLVVLKIIQGLNTA